MILQYGNADTRGPGACGAPEAAQERLLTVAQAAQEVGCSRDTIRRAYGCGALRIMRVGSRVRVWQSDLASWIDSGGRTK
jgi:excisionase family DNA binding protein